MLILVPALNIDTLGQEAEKEISFRSELEKLSSLDNLPRYCSDVKSLQVSSYDRTGGNNDGFAGTYSYLRQEADSALVIFDAEGKGVIHRIWTPTPTRNTLDFYIGDTTKVTFSIPFSDLFSGEVYPFTPPLCGNEIGGFYAYTPIPYENGCKIVFRGDVVRFIQIQYSELADHAMVKSFSLNLNVVEQRALEEVAAVWSGERILKQSADLLKEETEVELAPGTAQTIFRAEKGGRILGIEIDQARLFEGEGNRMDIKISYDNETIPAIHVPVADFFGYAFGKHSMQGVVAGTRDNVNYCYLPMPYDQQAKIELIYRDDGSATELRFNTRVWYSNRKRDKKKEGKLYVAWNRVPESEEGIPLTMARVKGKGHYVGTVMQTQNLDPGMTLFFEGDDMAIVDGKNTIHGTGSEDYFNGGWYAFLDTWDRAMSLPLHGSLAYSLAYGRTGAYRWHLTDKINFRESLDYTMEHGPNGNKEAVTNTTLGFYYCDTPKLEMTEPTNELSRVYIPETYMLYPQTMKLNLWIDVEMKTEWCLPSGGFTYIFQGTDESRIRVSLDELPPGRYKMYLDYKETSEGCEVSFWQRQNQVSGEINTYASEKARIEKLYVCDLEVDESKNTLTIRFQTEEERIKLFLNRLIFEKAE